MADLSDLDCQFYPIGSTPLHLAANNNNTKTLLQLLYSYQDLPARLELTDGHGRTPLVVALQNGRKEAAYVLIQAGASLEARYQDNTTVLNVLGREKHFIPLLSDLVSTNALAHLTQASVAPLLHILSYEHTKEDLSIQDSKPTFDSPVFESDSTVATALRKIERILQMFPKLIDSKDHLGLTALHYAAMNGNVELIRLLLRFSPDLKARNPYGSTVLHIACGKGRLEAVQVILSQRNDPTSILNSQDQLDRTPLHVAMYSKQLQVAQFIVEQLNSLIDPTLRDSLGHTVTTLLFRLRFTLGLKLEHTLSIPCLSVEEATWLLHECVSHGNLEGVGVALSQGAIVNSFDFMQQTPLLLASKLGHIEMCEALVEGGADPNVYDESLKTPIHYACKLQKGGVFQYLLSVDNIDLQLFYQTYDHPLTTEQVECLTSYYRNTPSAQLPHSWLEWLALAASNPAISTHLFSSFAQQICPSNWLQQLAIGQDMTGNEQVTAPEGDVPKYPVLSSLVQKAETTQVSRYRHQSFRLRKPAKKVMRELKGSKQITLAKKSAPFFFKKFRQIKFRTLPRKVVYFGPRSCLKSVSPSNQLAALLYCTLTYKNFNLFTSLLTEALKVDPDCAAILFPQGQQPKPNICTFIDTLGENFELVEGSLDSLGITEMVKSCLIEKDPLNFCMEKALLLYLISGSVKHHYKSLRSNIVIRKPFPSWSLWYIHLRCKWSLQSLGWKDEVTFSTSKKREEMATYLLENCTKSSLIADSADTVTLDPSFLMEAVRSNCVWAVQLLLKYGASPLAQSNKKYALVEAIRHRRILIINSLLDAWSHDLYQDHMTDELLSALCKSLLVLASHEEAVSIQRILSTFDLYESEQLWHCTGPRLLYLLLSSPSPECVELGKLLAESAAGFLCHTLVHSRSTDVVDSLSVNLLATKLLRGKFLRDFVDLLIVCAISKMTRSRAFFYACENGMYSVASYFLKHLKPADLEFLINTREDNPLTHAATSGDYDTVVLLAEYGFKPEFCKDPPLYKYFLSLVKSKSSCPHRVSICHSPNCLLHSNIGTKKQEAILDILLPSKEYLREILKVWFPFNHFVKILELKIAERILLDVLSVYRSDAALARDTDWGSIAGILSHQIFKFSVHKLGKMSSMLDGFFVELSPVVSYDSYAVVHTAKAGMWGFVCLMFRDSESLTDVENLVQVLTVASKQGRVEVLQTVYSMITTCDHWIHSKTYQFISVAAQSKQAETIDFLFSQIKAHLSEALKSVVKFGDALCFSLAIKQVLHSQPSQLEDNLLSLVMTASLYNSKDILSLIEPLFFSSNSALDHEEKQVLLYTTVIDSAVKCGHSGLALYALDVLPKHLMHRLTEDTNLFHRILCWCCYWGVAEVLERLPFTPDQLLHRESPTESSPWECALAQGHIGKISYLANAPSLPLAMSHSLDFEAEHLMVGAFSKLMATSQSSDQTIFVTNYCVFGRELYGDYNNPINVNSEAVSAVLLCLGKYAGEFICLRHVEFMDPVKVTNEEAFDVLLYALQDADLLHTYFRGLSTDDSECFVKIVAYGSVRRVKALLNRGVDILVYEESCHSTPSGSLLHTAVCTKDAEMVDLVLGVYGDKAPDACYRSNSEEEYPLHLAFALGATSVLSKESLLRTAYEADSDKTEWKTESSKAHGWFHYMMMRNEQKEKDSLLDQTHDHDETDFSFNIRETAFESKTEFLLKVVREKNFHIATSMIESAGKFLNGHNEDIASLVIEHGSDVYMSNEFVRDGNKSTNFEWILPKLLSRYHNEKQMSIYMKHEDLRTPDQVLTVFYNSCSLNKHAVAQKLLDLRGSDGIVQSALKTKELELGILLAIASGCYTTAAYLSLETDITFDSISDETAHYKTIELTPPHTISYRTRDDSFPLAENVSELPKLIFSSVSYYSLLEKFFDSVCNKEKLSLAGAWLAHNWTRLESQLFVKRLGNTSYAPSNPWQLPLTGEDGASSEILVTIDWDSFSESFLTSPLPDGIQEKHRYTPLLVEAIVFSPAVLGQICGDSGSDRKFNPLPFFSKLFQLSTLIVTAQAWPMSPSFKVYGDQGILTLSCRPSDGSISFPSSEGMDAYSEGILPPMEDSGIQSSFDSSAISSGASEQLKEVCFYFKKLLKKVVWKGASVVIECDHDIDQPNLNSVITQALHDTVDAVELVLHPNVLFSGAYSGTEYKVAKRTISSIHGSLPLLNTLSVQLSAADRYSYGHSNPVSVTRQGETLTIYLVVSPITMDDSLEQEGLDREDISIYEALVEGLTECLLEAEKEVGMTQVERTISKKILPNLSHSLRIGTLDEDFVTIDIQDKDDSTHTLNKLSSITIPQVKSLIKLANFVNSFAKLLQVFSYKPRLIRGMFDGGLKVLLCNKAPTSFSVIGGHSFLKFSASDLHNKTNNENMIQVYQSVLAAANLRGVQSSHSIKFPLLIPAPFSCYLDNSKSTGYLYPRKGESGTITVQLVDFNGDPLTSLPTNQCVLSVSVKDPTSVVLSASSSTDPHPKAASKNLLVNLKAEGTFEIQWTPQELGLHDISIRLNQIPIKGSPFKASTYYNQAGYRQVIAGSQLQFVVSHKGYSCERVRPAISMPESVRPLIVPMCLKAMETFIETSKRNSEVEPATGCIRVDSVQKAHPRSVKTDPQSDTRAPHYISMLYKFGKPSLWRHRADGGTSVFVSKTDEKGKEIFFTLQTQSLSNGMSVVSMVTRRACVLKVFAVCTSCQAVLTMQWRDQVGMDPAPCYVTPGPFCAATSIVKFDSVNVRKIKDPVQITAGHVKSFRIKAYDTYRNKHSVGGAITSAMLQVVCSSSENVLPEHRHLINTPQNVTCDVEDKNDGTYIISVSARVTGMYTLMVDEQTCVTQLTVTSGPPKASNCRLLAKNYYEVSASYEAQCEVALYDEYFNPCSSKWIGSHVRHTFRPWLASTTNYYKNVVCFNFKPRREGSVELEVYASNELLPTCPIHYTVLKAVETFSMRYKKLRSYLNGRYGNAQTPTFTVDRNNILESSMRVFNIHEDYFRMHLRVRFGEEPGIDAGGVARELFHLLSLELVNPQYALFQNINGLYKPSQSSSVNHDHLLYFNFFGKILGRAIADYCQLPVRFTPSVYKYLLSQECSLDDLKMEDPTLHMSLLSILNCESEDTLQELAVNFTAQRSHFGALHTIELEEGGEEKSVTMANKEEFVNKLCTWHLVGCIKDQLTALKRGIDHVVSLSQLANFSAHELEVILSGQSEVDISFIHARTRYTGYSHHTPVVEWLWEVLEEFSQEERCQFLQFTTGCSSLPNAEITEWSFRIQRGSSDSNLLPGAATCFNSITLPVYKSKEALRQKLLIAISYGQQAFLVH